MQQLAVFAMSTIRCENDCTLTEFFKPHSIMGTANHRPIARNFTEKQGQWTFNRQELIHLKGFMTDRTI